MNIYTMPGGKIIVFEGLQGLIFTDIDDYYSNLKIVGNNSNNVISKKRSRYTDITIDDCIKEGERNPTAETIAIYWQYERENENIADLKKIAKRYLDNLIVFNRYGYKPNFSSSDVIYLINIVYGKKGLTHVESFEVSDEFRGLK